MNSETLIIAGLFVLGMGVLFLLVWGRIKALSTMLIGLVNEESRKSREELIHTLRELSDSNEQRMDRIRDTIDQRLQYIQESNEKKLDQMRQTVDITLQSTLERRIGESFKLVSERLEAVQQGLGEMRNLAKGVGDLKRVLSNVKARGTWGEIQLGAILEQILTPDQYAKNVRIGDEGKYVVEYAIKLPGPDNGRDSHIWLPIDSKFPQEDYIRLLDAVEKSDTELIQKASTGIARSIYSSAKDISDKYIRPPFTTDFAIMFLPTEGLYAEALRHPGQIEEIQRKFRIVVAGPTTLSAILNSIRLGFQSIALQKRSHEVWMILGAVKTEFEKFGEILSRLKRQIMSVSNTLEKTEVRTRAMQRRLKEVESIPEDGASHLLKIEEDVDGSERKVE